VLGDDIFSDADLERPTPFVRSEEAKWIKRGELVDALVHPKSLSEYVKANVLHPEAFHTG
jgi:hypothetical protein